MPITNPLKGLSKTQAYVAVGGAAAIGGYLVIHHHATTGSWNPWSSPASSSASGAIDPLTGLPASQDNSVDPVTGLSYLAEAQQYGSVSAAEASVSAYGQSTASGSGIPVNPASPGTAGSPNNVVGGSVYTSDSAWSQAAQAGLTDIGYIGTDVSAALGLYLTGQPVTADQAKIINAAVAEYGAPPQGTFQITLVPATAPSPATGTVSVPYVVGKNLSQAISIIENAGLKEHTSTLAAYANPSKWKAAGQNPAGGKVMPGSTITVSATRI